MSVFSVEELLKTAREITGLEDFGDPRYRGALEHLVLGINNAPNFRRDRAGRLGQELISLLMNRLWTTKDIKEHPEILEQQLMPPVCICSLPRTGTTKLHRILSVCGSFQYLPYWQMRMPARIPGYADEGRARRITEAEEFCEWEAATSPEFQKGYTRKADEPEEELIVMDQSFNDANLGLVHGAPEYLAWIAKNDFSATYDYLLLQLKYLQWQFNRDEPKPYVLKTPGHLGNEDQLKRIFPQGINLVFSHRDPKAILASLCHLTGSSRKLYYHTDTSNEALGQLLLNWFSDALMQHMSWRDRNPDIKVLDMAFKDITADSVGTLVKIHEFLGKNLDQEGIEKIEQWDRKNPRHKHGKPEFTLEDYGLSPEVVDRRFAPYMERFAGYF
tara:strand:- start:17475 stop:18638 length:1164 start_codon:yes stop_codon:yes gene_type:complete